MTNSYIKQSVDHPSSTGLPVHGVREFCVSESPNVMRCIADSAAGILPYGVWWLASQETVQNSGLKLAKMAEYCAKILCFFGQPLSEFTRRFRSLGRIKTWIHNP